MYSMPTERAFGSFEDTERARLQQLEVTSTEVEKMFEEFEKLASQVLELSGLGYDQLYALYQKVKSQGSIEKVLPEALAGFGAEASDRLKKRSVEAKLRRMLNLMDLLVDYFPQTQPQDKKLPAEDVMDYYFALVANREAARKQWSEMERNRIRLAEELIEATNTGFGDADTISAILTEQSLLQEEWEALIEKHPEVFLDEKMRDLRRMKATLDAGGRIVETPYVKMRINDIRSYVKVGRPIFIYGELGSGKTELTRYICENELSEPHLERWEKEHPRPEGRDRKAMEEWEIARKKEAEPEYLNCSKTTDVEQLLGARAIQRKEGLTPDEQVREMTAHWDRFRKEMIQDLQQRGELSEGEIRAEVNALRSDYMNAMRETFRNPVETLAILGPVLRAMKLGKPVILDEMNATPAHVLVVLNDLLMRKPGDRVFPPIPGAESFTVHEGFYFIGTGNYKPADPRYTGTQAMNPAFMSRLGKVPYDYLPMAREKEAANKTPENIRKDRQNDELFHMMVTRLVEDDLTARLPESAFRKIRQLAIAARQVQDIFSGIESSQFSNLGTGRIKPQDVLRENVLSLRHLIPILESWKQNGFTESLDDLLYRMYIQESSYLPDEKKMLYTLLKTHDFFQEMKFGTTEQLFPDPSKLSSFHFDTVLKERKKLNPATKTLAYAPKMRQYTSREIVEECFGPAPTREGVPEEYFAIKEQRKKGNASADQPKAPERTDQEKADLARKISRFLVKADRQIEVENRMGTPTDAGNTQWEQPNAMKKVVNESAKSGKELDLTLDELRSMSKTEQ